MFNQLKLLLVFTLNKQVRWAYESYLIYERKNNQFNTLFKVIFDN